VFFGDGEAVVVAAYGGVDVQVGLLLFGCGARGAGTLFDFFFGDEALGVLGLQSFEPGKVAVEIAAAFLPQALADLADFPNDRVVDHHSSPW
jgi:hypothetical protein